MKISKLVWKRGRGDKRPHYQTMSHWSSTIISVSSWKYTQIPAKTVKCTLNFEKNIRFPHNIAHLIVEEGWRRRARDKLRELYSELFTEIVLQLGRVHILSLSARTLLFWISLVSQFCTPEVNCRNKSSTKVLYSLCPLNILNNNSRSANYIATYKVQTSKWNYLPY